MDVALLTDGKFPNLALMKLSHWHKAQGDVVQWYVDLFSFTYDRVYISKIFTYSKVRHAPAGDIVKGGTGYDLTTWLPKEVDDSDCDYSLYPDYPHAVGFLTRGCPRKCPECVVPEKEGKVYAYRNIESVLQGRGSAVLLDNNVLSSMWGLKQIERIAELQIPVDFNQGLDARLITPDVAKLLVKVKWLRFIRMACDDDKQIPAVTKAVTNLRKAGSKVEIFCYVLVKDDELDSALYRCETLRALNVDPFAQPYRDQAGTPSNADTKAFGRWVNRKALFKSMAWHDYESTHRRNADPVPV